MNKVKYHKIFETGIVPDDMCEMELVANALEAWGNCHMGIKPTENFGIAMAEIGCKLNISATAENLIEYAIVKGYLKN